MKLQLTNPRKLISASIGIASLAALSTALPGLTQSSPMQGGSMQGSPMQNGSMQSNPMQNGSMQQTTPSSTSLSAVDRQFMMKAAQSDMTEIRTSQLALQRSQNAQVRQFAQEMIQQHTQSSNKLKPLAAQKGVTLPKTLGAQNQALYTQLTKLSGAQFNRAYMSGQAQAHARTQALYQQELQQGSDQDVKMFANQVLPVVTAHLRMAQNMIAGR